jgi:hypothetical protein
MKNGSQHIVNALMMTPNVIEAFLSLITELVLFEADIIDEPGLLSCLLPSSVLDSGNVGFICDVSNGGGPNGGCAVGSCIGRGTVT